MKMYRTLVSIYIFSIDMLKKVSMWKVTKGKLILIKKNYLQNDSNTVKITNKTMMLRDCGLRKTFVNKKKSTFYLICVLYYVTLLFFQASHYFYQ